MKLFIAGDSVMAQYNISVYPLTGIGMALNLYVKPEVHICNFACSGRSTKSYFAEGIPDIIQKEIGSGDFLMISFGHNDEKLYNEALFTNPYDDYPKNLKALIAIARDAGAIPILITPLERRLFMDASDAWYNPNIPPETAYTLRPSAHTEYTAAMHQVAVEENVACIDLTMLSRRALQEAGPVGSARWYMNLAPNEYPAYPNGLLDNTHLTYEGAVKFGGLLAEAIKRLGAPYTALFIDDF